MNREHKPSYRRSTYDMDKDYSKLSPCELIGELERMVSLSFLQEKADVIAAHLTDKVRDMETEIQRLKTLLQMEREDYDHITIRNRDEAYAWGRSTYWDKIR